MSLVVGTGAVNCLERLVSEVICYGTVQGKLVVLDLSGSIDWC